MPVERHRRRRQRLVAEGQAYRCYCTAEQLQTRRAAAEAAGGAWKYDRACLALDVRTRAAYDREQRLSAVRFLVPAGVAICAAAGCVLTDLAGGPVGAGPGLVAAADAETSRLLLAQIRSLAPR